MAKMREVESKKSDNEERKKSYRSGVTFIDTKSDYNDKVDFTDDYAITTGKKKRKYKFEEPPSPSPTGKSSALAGVDAFFADPKEQAMRSKRASRFGNTTSKSKQNSRNSQSSTIKPR